MLDFWLRLPCLAHHIPWFLDALKFVYFMSLSFALNSFLTLNTSATAIGLTPSSGAVHRAEASANTAHLIPQVRSI